MSTLFQIAKNKLQSSGQITVKAATGILDSIIARAKIRTLEKEKKKYYIEIGKKLYDMSSDGCDIAFEEEIASINKLQKKIEQKLEQISNEREELLKEAWSIAYKLCDDKEKQKSNMVS
mgnify:FL=1